MANNTETSLVSTFIRWTDNEWLQIARHLCATQGHATMDVLDLTKIRAKDIFEAQVVLSEDRHRKLASIAQKFGRIPARLTRVIENYPIQ
jgi:hypothetical protein